MFWLPGQGQAGHDGLCFTRGVDSVMGLGCRQLTWSQAREHTPRLAALVLPDPHLSHSGVRTRNGVGSGLQEQDRVVSVEVGAVACLL